jgi:hypothetical protein
MTRYLLMLTLLISCSKSKEVDQSVCGVENPVQHLKWLNEFTTQMQNGELGDCRQCIVYQETYMNRKVLIVDKYPDNCILCQIRECDGSFVKFKNSEDAHSFINTLKKNKVVWQFRP